MQEKQLCPVCLSKGRKSYLKSFQVNLEEALWLCENKRCIYPLGQDADPTFNRRLDDLPSERDNTRVPSAQLALQIQVASRLTQYHQRKQTDVIGRNNCRGIQTGSPLFMKNFSKHQGVKQKGLNTKPYQNGLTGNTQNGAKDSQSPFKALDGTTTADSSGECKFPGLQLGIAKAINGTSKDGKPSQIATLDSTKNFNNHNFENINNLNSNSNGSSISNFNGSSGIHNCVEGDGRSRTVDTYSDSSKTDTVGLLTNCLQVNHEVPSFPQWKNRDALCWLDVVLCLLVHNKLLNKLVDRDDGLITNSLIYKLTTAHSQARALLVKQKLPSGNGLLIGQNGHESVNSSHKQGLSQQNGPLQNGKTAVVESGEAIDQLDGLSLNEGLKSSDVLDNVRDEIWQFVQKKIQCEKGRPSSPVQAIHALLQSDPAIEGLFRASYKFTYNCPHCKFLEDTDCESVLPSLPAVVREFNILNPVHKKKCLNCSYTKGRRKMVHKILPKSFMMHFLEGLPPNRWSSLDFTTDSVHYAVTGVVQYLRNPDHFVAWLRNPSDNTWILCDDLKSPICPVRTEAPHFSWKQIHIVMWEQTSEPSPSNVKDREHVMKDITVVSRTGQTANQACVEWLKEQTKFSNKGALPNGVTKVHSSMLNKKIEDCIGLRNGILIHTSDESVSCLKTSASSSNEYAKSSKGRTFIDLNYSSSEMNATKQHSSIDPLRFLKSSTTFTSSSAERSACSSISSTCSELSDNVSLPEFVSTALVGDQLIKPIPCRNDSPVQNSEFSDRNASEAEPNCDSVLSSDKVCSNDKGSKTFRAGNKDIDAQLPNTSDQGSRLIPSIKPSSVFCPPSKTIAEQAKVGRQESVIPELNSINATLNKTDDQNENSAKLKAINSDDWINSTIMKIESTISGNVSIIKEEPNKAIGDKHNFRFKLPGILRKRTKPSTISRDAFRTFTKTVDKVKTETAPSVSPSDKLETRSFLSSPASPVTGNTAPYLSAVKRYLIDKTTDKSHSKTRFEGLNLKSAPNLGRSIDLSGLKRNDTDNSPEVKSSPASEMASRNTKLSIVSDTLLKRRRQLLSKDPSSKRLKTEHSTLSGKTLQTTNVLNGSAPKLITYTENSNPQYGHDGTTGGDPSSKKEVVGKDNMKHLALPKDIRSGDTFQSPEKTLNTADPETGSILQDLYDALNIPFTSIKDTMSDIMVDVNDILGTMEMKDLDSCQSGKAGGLPGSGNQTHLDCGLGLMNRLVPQSPPMARQIWSPYTILDKILVIS